MSMKLVNVEVRASPLALMNQTNTPLADGFGRKLTFCPAVPENVSEGGWPGTVVAIGTPGPPAVIGKTTSGGTRCKRSVPLPVLFAFGSTMIVESSSHSGVNGFHETRRSREAPGCDDIVQWIVNADCAR